MCAFQLVRALCVPGARKKDEAASLTRADPYDSGGYEILARHFRAASDWEQANAAIEKALDISPEAPGLNALAGEIYHEQGRSEDARAAWQLALTVKPNVPGSKNISTSSTRTRTTTIPALPDRSGRSA